MEMTAPSVNVFKDLYFFKACSMTIFTQLSQKITTYPTFDRVNYEDLVESFFYSYEKIWTAQCMDWNFLQIPKDPHYSWATLISNDELTFFKNGFTVKESAKPDSIIMFIGGGGFISSTEKLQELFLRNWAKEMKISIWEFHYKLAPEFKYPFQVHEILESYLGILFYYKHFLGIEFKNIILMGDSAGGNLCMSLTNLLILFKQRVPDYLVLVYPATNLSEKRFTPSLLNSFNERLLYFSILEKCISSYIPENYKPEVDWLLSPGVAPDAIFAKYPKTDILGGEFDPLFDDGYRLGHKLKELGVETRMYIFENMYHGFLGFDLPLGQGISEVSKVHDHIRDQILAFVGARKDK